MKTLNKTIAEVEQNRAKIHAEWLKEVQAIADKFQVEIATGHLSDRWQASEPGKEAWVIEYDAEREDTPDNVRKALQALVELDEKTTPHGVGPSNMERFKPAPKLSEYEQQAEQFLTRNGIKFRATLSDSKPAPWESERSNYAQRIPTKASKERHHYRITLSRTISKPRPTSDPSCFKSDRVVFDFWGSIADAEAGNKTVTPYDVLACISSDANCPETFRDFCAEYGYSDDSLSAMQTFRRCSAFSKRLRAFFTPQELEELSEIN